MEVVAVNAAGFGPPGDSEWARTPATGELRCTIHYVKIQLKSVYKNSVLTPQFILNTI